MNGKQQDRIIREIQDVQFKLMRTATLENKSHAERNAETRDVVKDLQRIIDIVNMTVDEFANIDCLPF